MKRNTLVPIRTNFDALFAILSRISGRPKDDLVNELGDAVIRKARDPNFLFTEITPKRYNRFLKAGKLEQASIITSILENTHEKDSTFFWK